MGVTRRNKKKKWFDNRNKKRMRQLSRQKRERYSNPSGKTPKHKGSPYFLRVPDDFSILNNASETIKFFSDVFEMINVCSIQDSIFFDMENTKNVTPDAIMYLIAVINNTRRVRTLKISCKGNIPLSPSARKLIESVGFYNYVKPLRTFAEPKDSERIKILHGEDPNGETTSQLCDFVNDKINSKSMLETKRLYPILVELMTNVRQHAYKGFAGTLQPRWYTYAENRDKDIRFVFLDTGQGIPNTVRKDWAERIRDLFGDVAGNSGDSDYIEAALKGDFRTETNQRFRGKGLPEVYNSVISSEGRLTELSIISGHGKCYVSCDGSIEKEYMDNPFEGTLFMWSFRKEGD